MEPATNIFHDAAALAAPTIFMIISLAHFWKWACSRTWRETGGKVTLSNIRRSWAKYGRREEFELAYRFDVAGRTYVGTNRFPGGFIAANWIDAFFGSAQQDQQKYRVGSEVRVFYNPDNPKDCSIERGAVWESLLIFSVSVGIFVLVYFSVFG